MTKSKSWAQHEYQYAYRLFRRGFSYKTLWDSGEHFSDILKAADYSYQAKDYQEMGWSGEMRRHRFHAIKWRILAGREEMSP